MSFQPDNETQETLLLNLFTEMLDELRLIREMMAEMTDTYIQHEDVKEPNQ